MTKPASGVSTAARNTRVASVLACTVSVPLEESVSLATRKVTAHDYALVKVLGEDGVQGIGFCYGGSVGGRIVMAVVRELRCETASCCCPRLPDYVSISTTGRWRVCPWTAGDETGHGSRRHRSSLPKGRIMGHTTSLETRLATLGNRATNSKASLVQHAPEWTRA